MITVLDISQKQNKQEKINQKQEKLVHFLVTKRKIFHKTIKNSLKNVAAGGFATLRKR